MSKRVEYIHQYYVELLIRDWNATDTAGWSQGLTT